jgi:hypothetical protein
MFAEIYHKSPLPSVDVVYSILMEIWNEDVAEAVRMRKGTKVH